MQVITILSDLRTFTNVEDTFVIVYFDLPDDASKEDIEIALQDPERGEWHPLYNDSQQHGWTDFGQGGRG